MSPATDEGHGGRDGARATFGDATVLDGATYQLPDGRAVRAFVHVRDDSLPSSVSVTLHTAEEWATDDLPYYTLDRIGRVMRQSWSRNAWAHLRLLQKVRGDSTIGLPLLIRIGSVTFEVEGAVTEQELHERILRASEYVRALPDELLDGMPRGTKSVPRWDPSARKWFNDRTRGPYSSI